MITMDQLRKIVEEWNDRPVLTELRMNGETRDAVIAWHDANRTLRAANLYGVQNLWSTPVVLEELLPDGVILPVWSDGTVGRWPA